MSRPSNILVRAINYDHTLVLSVELSNKSWVLAAQVPGLPRTKAQRTIEPNKNALLAAIDGYRARAAAVGYTVDRVITTYEAGWSGFWLARWLVAQGVEVHVVQPKWEKDGETFYGVTLACEQIERLSKGPNRADAQDHGQEAQESQRAPVDDSDIPF